MKKQKLTLDELKVQSFVTHYDSVQGMTLDVRGGGGEQVLDPTSGSGGPKPNTSPSGRGPCPFP